MEKPVRVSKSTIEAGIIKILAVIVLGLGLFGTGSLYADQIEFLDGRKFKGKVIEQKDTVIVFEASMGGAKMRMNIPIKNVRAIVVNGKRTVVSEDTAVQQPGQAPGRRTGIKSGAGGKRPVSGETTIGTISAGPVKVKGSVRSTGSGGIFEAKASARTSTITAPIELVVIPSYVGDDVVLDPRECSGRKTVYVPCDQQLVLGLLKGRDGMLVVTWPQGQQEIHLKVGQGLFESMDFKHGGKSAYMAVLTAPGIWHRQKLDASHMERDVDTGWNRPFSARWVTYFKEKDVRTRYYFYEKKGQVPYYRNGIGKYTWPAWFEGNKGMLHPSKRAQPDGETVIYCVERNKSTPARIVTPADIAAQALAGQAAAVLDVEGRVLDNHVRRTGKYTVAKYGCCSIVDDMRKNYFQKGQEVSQAQYIKEGLEDTIFYTEVHKKREKIYLDFATDILQLLGKSGKTQFTQEMGKLTQEMLQLHSSKKKNIVTMEQAKTWAAEVEALTRKKDPQNLPTFNKLRLESRRTVGTMDEVIRKFNTQTRNLFQRAALSAKDGLGDVKVAEEIRRRARDCLRNPTFTEVWEEY